MKNSLNGRVFSLHQLPHLQNLRRLFLWGEKPIDHVALKRVQKPKAVAGIGAVQSSCIFQTTPSTGLAKAG